MKKTHIKKFLSIVLFTMLFTNAFSAKYYWVPSINSIDGAGTWSELEHWSKVSGSMAPGDLYAAVPTANDTVYFDINSFVDLGEPPIVNIDADALCKRIDCSGSISFAINLNDMAVDPILTVYGSVIAGKFQLQEIGGTGYVNFAGSAAETIDVGAYIMGAEIRFTGAGQYSLNNNFNGKSITINSPNAEPLVINNKNITLTDNFTVMGNATLNLGSSTITTNNFTVSNGATVNAGTSVISCRGDFSGAGKTYNSVHFTKGIADQTLSGSNTYKGDLTIDKSVTLNLEAGSTQTLEGNLSADGLVPATAITIKSTVDGTKANFLKSNGAVTVNYVKLQDNDASGGATFTANNSNDLSAANVSGWNLAPVPGFYWVGGTGKWSEFATHWATTAGGNVFQANAPTQNDDVYFTAQSFSNAGETVTIDAADVAICKSMHWDNATNSPKFVVNNYLHIYGGLTFINAMTVTFDPTKKIYFNATSGNYNIITSGKNFGNIVNIVFDGAGGTWTFQGILNNAKSIEAVSGSLFTNNYAITLFDNFTVNSIFTALYLSGSVITANKFSMDPAVTTFNAGNSSITCSKFFGGNKTYNNVTLKNSANDTVTGSNSYNGTLKINPGATVFLEANSTQTLVGNLDANGTPGNTISIKSTQAGTQAKFVKSSGTVTVNYVNLYDNDASGGATFTANNSNDLAGNNVTGWNENPTVNIYSPSDDATDVALNSNLILTFSENVKIGTGKISIFQNADPAIEIDVTQTASVEINNNIVTVHPPASFNANADVYVLIEAGAFTDLVGNPYSGISDPTTWNFKTTTATNVSIGKTENTLQIYPNPSNDKITIVNKGDNTNSYVVMYDARGIKVAQYPLSNAASTTLDISALAKGAYFLELNNNKKITQRKLIVKL